MSIKKFAKVSFNTEKVEVCSQLEAFISGNQYDTFILGGHAGTGKTTIIQALIGYLIDKDIHVVLLASTGRAARVVAMKACYMAETVHRHIYVIDEEHLDEINKIKRLRFTLRKNITAAGTIFIVDESSMISDNNSGSVFLQFGSGRLLNDFLMYTENRKVIFAGDPCQLPPVHYTTSPALDANYLQQQYNRNVKSANLTESMRFTNTSGIFQVTDNLRRMVDQQYNGNLRMNVSNQTDMEIINNNIEMINQYAAQIKRSGVDSAIFITFSNALANDVNLRVRNLLFRTPGILEKGELLMVTQNNYLHNVSNGDHMVVTEISNETKTIGQMKLRKITAYTQDVLGNRVVQPWIIEDLLLASKPSLQNEQEAELFIDFLKRYVAAGIITKSPEFIDAWLNDPYLNALRVRYGYAVTCHKAQGGEWPHVYTVFENSLFYQTPQLLHRWAYTALSRASQRLYLLNNSCIY